jgi:Zn-dependent protease with chaperone function
VTLPQPEDFNTPILAQSVASPFREPPLATSTIAPIDRQLLARQVMQSFTGPIEPVKVPFTYRLGIGLVSLVMLILPLVYLALIGVVAYLVFYHMTHAYVILEGVRGRAAVAAFMLYLAPLIFGAVLVLFMLKPLFSRRAKAQEPRKLIPAHEPLLFDFVNRICDTVHAPYPSAIQVDNQVNASASFRRGIWSMLGDDLVLTIGLPLTAGLNMQQLAGVLAHEFGHFSQGAGMRLTFLIRTISHWFTRVVYERDQWDQWLVRASQAIDLRIGWIFYLTRLLVWLTRRILWCLMMVGNLVAGFMLRQMEFDADRHEARLASSNTFVETQWLIGVLGVSQNGAYSDLNEFYRDGRLPDNLPQLIEANVSQLPEALLEKLRQISVESKTSLLDTHPCDRERVTNALRENAAGVFHLRAPAKALFSDFDGLAKLVTREFYQEVFDQKFDAGRIHDTNDLIARQAKETENLKCLQRFSLSQFGGIGSIQLPYWQLSRSLHPAPKNQLESLRLQSVKLVPEFLQHCSTFHETHTQLHNLEQAASLLRAGFRLQQKTFNVKSLPDATAGISKNSQAIQTVWQSMHAFRRTLGDRLMIDLELLHHPKILQQIGEDETIISQVNQLLSVISHLQQQHALLEKLHTNYQKLEILMINTEGEVTEKHFNEFKSVMHQLNENIQQVQKNLRQVPYPFNHAQGEIPVSRFLLDEAVVADNPGSLHEAAGGILDNAQHLNARVFARLTELAERVERVFGLEPLPDFVSPPDDALPRD